VIGVNSQIATAGQTGNGNVGIGFAVPANTVRQVVPRLKQGQTIDRPYLGVRPAAPRRRSPTARSCDRAARRPGARGGLQTGDVIVAINGRRVDDPPTSRPASRARPRATW
jgi:putative serine protease PepD